MTTVSKLTKSVIDAAAPKAKVYYLWDPKITGFGIKVLPSGQKKYVVKYRAGGGRMARQRWFLVGAIHSMTLDEAKKEAQQALAAVARGEDPQSARFMLRNRARLRDVWTRFKSDHLPLRKPVTQREYVRIWTKSLSSKFGHVPVQDITRADVDRWHKKMASTPYEANRRLAVLSRLLALAEAWEIRDQGTNPCRYIEKFKERARNRYLTSAELEAIGRSLSRLVQLKGGLHRQMTPREPTDPEPIRACDANAIKMLMFTGARLNEILKAKWEWVDWERRVIELPDSKTGAKPIYLSEAAVGVLRDQQSIRPKNGSEFIFPGRTITRPMVNLRKPWLAVCRHAGIDGVRLHDLRHTAASVAVSQGVPLAIIGRLLGHTQAQTTQRYAHVDASPALAAANQIGNTLASAIS